MNNVITDRLQRRAARGGNYWLPLVEEYKTSGIGMREFCESRGIIEGTFKNWLYKSRRREREGSGRFVEVKLPEAEYRLVVSGDRELILKGGYDIRRVQELVSVLEGRDV